MRNADFKAQALVTLLTTLESGQRPSGGVSVDSGEIPSLGGENIDLNGHLRLDAVKRIPLSFFASMRSGRLEAGDVLINKDGAQTGKIAIYDGQFPQAAINEHVYRLRGDPDLLNQRYLYHNLLSERSQSALKLFITGSAQPGLNRTFAKGVAITIPPLFEQRRISEILDTVDDEIRSTDRLIEKLELTKEGLLQHLIHRDDDWHTTVVPLGELLIAIEAGWTPPSEDIAPSSDEWGVLKVSAISGGSYNPAEAKRLAKGVAPRVELEVHPGDVLLARANGVTDLVATVAEVQTTPQRLTISDKTLRLVPLDKRITGSYMTLALQSASSRRQVRGFLNGSSGQQNISQAQIRRIQISLPPLKEQVEIVETMSAVGDHLQAERVHLTKVFGIRRGLMHDLLSGRVRVTVDDTDAA
jgi:type I restriction enzyme S subunit